MDINTPTPALFLTGLQEEDRIVRNTCAAYLDLRPDTTEAHAAAALQSLNQFGPKAFRSFHYLYSFPLGRDEFKELKRLFHRFEERESKLRLLPWLVRTERKALPEVVEFLESVSIFVPPRLSFLGPESVLSRVAARMEFQNLDDSELTPGLEQIFREMNDAEAFPHKQVEVTEWLLDEMRIRLGHAKLKALAYEWLEQDPEAATVDFFKLGFGAYLVGQLGLESQVDRMLDLYEIDSDWLNEVTETALVKLGNARVFSQVRDRWDELPSVGRLFSSTMFEVHHPEGYDDFYDRALEKEMDWWEPLFVDFALAQLHLGTESALNAGLENFKHEPYNPEFTVIAENLLAHSRLRNVPNGEEDFLRRIVEASETRFDAFEESRNFRPSGLDDGHVEDNVTPFESIEEESPSRSVHPPGRNDPCPCGSGKKYKKCCLGK